MHTLFEISVQEIFCNIKALKLVHGFKLRFSFTSSNIEVLVLNLDSLNLFFNFTLPFLVIISLSLMILIFELSNLFNFMLLFNFKNSLINTFAEKNIENWLNLLIIVKEIIIFNLSDLIDTSFLWNVLRSWWFWLEIVSLQFHFCLSWLRFTLFS